MRRRGIVGIYIIRSIIKPYRHYVGSSVNIKKRWREHLKSLLENKHHSKKLQRHYNKYGINDLEFVIIETCYEDVLIEREQFYIDSQKPYFNNSPTAGSTRGIKMSPDVIERNRIAQTGKHHTAESKKKIGDAFRGIPRSLEVRMKVSEKLKGHVVTQETRDKLVIAHTGRKKEPITEETREKQRLAQAKLRGVSVTAINDGRVLVFISILEAARYFNINQCIIRTRIKKGYDYNGWNFYKTLNNE